MTAAVRSLLSGVINKANVIVNLSAQRLSQPSMLRLIYCTDHNWMTWWWSLRVDDDHASGISGRVAANGRHGVSICCLEDVVGE